MEENIPDDLRNVGAAFVIAPTGENIRRFERFRRRPAECDHKIVIG
jgi:hypothetical protein